VPEVKLIPTVDEVGPVQEVVVERLLIIVPMILKLLVVVVAQV